MLEGLRGEESISELCHREGIAASMYYGWSTITADGTRIRQALLALLENARRYAKPGRVEIATLMSGGRAIIQVEDEGPGLPPEFAQRAFEPLTLPLPPNPV